MSTDVLGELAAASRLSGYWSGLLRAAPAAEVVVPPVPPRLEPGRHRRPKGAHRKPR